MIKPKAACLLVTEWFVERRREMKLQSCKCQYNISVWHSTHQNHLLQHYYDIASPSCTFFFLHSPHENRTPCESCSDYLATIDSLVKKQVYFYALLYAVFVQKAPAPSLLGSSSYLVLSIPEFISSNTATGQSNYNNREIMLTLSFHIITIHRESQRRMKSQFKEKLVHLILLSACNKN